MKQKIIDYISSTSYIKENIDELQESLNIDATSFKDFIKAINELEDEGIIYITSRGYIHYASRINIFLGKVKTLKRYSAIVELKDGDSVIIYNEFLKNAYLDDIVRIHLNNDGTGEVMDVISHSMWEVVATFKHHDFIVDERNFPYDLLVKKGKGKFHLVEGHVVLLRVLKYEGNSLICEVSKILGHRNDPGMDILKAIIASNVKYEFDQELLDYTDKLIDQKEKNFKLELNGRKDLTDELIVTIDGLDAKDLDDAVSLKINEDGNYVLGVHIADVSNFVTKDSIIDKEAFTRGTSIYLADRVIPMLPHSLCNGICSLNENETRLTMSCIMEINNEGEVINYEITPSFIKSKARLDYDDVNNLFDNKPTRLTYSKDIKEMLFMMRRLSSILYKKMVNNGYIELNIDEAKLIMDDNSRILNIEKRVQRDAEKLIENFMILANETVASHIYYMQLPFIYRVHAEISKEKLAFLTDSLKDFNIKINSHQNYVNSKQIQEILANIKGKPSEYVINSLILRSMSKACYSVNNIGHFGLGSKCYTHFTSPIRRYPDLIVHRFLKKYLVNNDYSDEMEFLVQAAENSSVNERKAIGLERDVEDMKKAEYMRNFIGCTYDGVISGMMDFGLFVTLPNTCEGLIRFDSYKADTQFLGYNYFYSRFKLGQAIKVKVIDANPTKGEIDFAYVSKKAYNKATSKSGGVKHGKTYKHK